MQTIEQYIQSNLSDRLVRRGNSPLMGLVLLAVGIALIVAAFAAADASNAQTALLAVGFLCAAVGAVMAVLCLTRVMWHYVDLRTGHAMRMRNVYLSPTDFERTLRAIEQGQLPTDLHPINSSNLQMKTLVGDDLALVQLGHLDTSQFGPSCEVMQTTPQALPRCLGSEK